MLKNLKIKWRLALCFSLILIFLISIILHSLNQIKVSHDKLTRIVTINNVRIELANVMIDNARETAINIRNVLLSKYQNHSIDKIQKTADGLTERRKNYQEAKAKLEALIPKEDTKAFEMLREVNLVADTVVQYQDKVIAIVRSGNINDATDFMFGESYPSVTRWVTQINDLIIYNMEYNALRYDQAVKAQIAARLVMIILGISVIVLSLIIAVLLTQSITKPLKISVDAANRIASKDLTVDLSFAGKRNDELGVLMEAFSKMTGTLREQMLEIQDVVNTLAGSSSEILASSTQIAAGTAETAASINETTATVEEIRQAAQLSSEKAKNVSDSAQRNVKAIETGQNAVEATISGMNHIREQMESIANTIVSLSEQSQLIGAIIASVNDISDQSNLLAVNAAIEASKAGEQGKGFTVVAQEIKSLAEQSKKATAQVRNILSDIQKATSAAVMATEQGSKAVESGVKQSIQAGESIRLLAESTDEALQVTTQIAASSQQQVVGMDQIGLAMENINQAGTENAVSMKQAENTAKDLHKLGLKLKQIVDQYKI